MILESEIGCKLISAKFRVVLVFVLVFVLFIPNTWSLAQEGETDEPVYVVQEGDSLWDIALRFRVSLEDLTQANGINDPSQLVAGTRLVIPGLEGVKGELVTETITYGDTLRSMSRYYRVPVDTIVQLNHLASPAELYVGSTLVIPMQDVESGANSRAMLAPGQSLLELAIAKGETPWAYVLANDLAGTWDIVPGDVLHLPVNDSTEQTSDGPSALPETIMSAALDTAQFVQGKAFSVRLSGDESLKLSGLFDSHEMHFYPDGNGNYVSLQGIHAMTEPGLYTMVLTATLPVEAPYLGAPFAFSQAVLVHDGDYFIDPPLTVSPETIDPAVTKPEDAQWAALAAPFTPQKMWEGVFQSPAPEIYKECWPSLFGNRRSYNGSPYIYFHSGLDFCGGVGTEILAPATGKVVFVGPLTVRGNATMIDHGWGVYTGYMHQSEILVSVGEYVEPGQVIGLVGGTGRVTGPHLHWEVWVGGVQVDPMDWLSSAFPS